MSAANTVVETILKSPAHPILSGSMVLLRHLTDRSGDEHTVAVQYADAHHGLLVVVGDPETTTWWRDFTEMGQAQVLLKGEWTPMTAHALRGADDAEAVTPLLRSYAQRHPRIVKQIDGDTLEERVANSVVVWLRPAS
jgi:hypothetical protein